MVDEKQKTQALKYYRKCSSIAKTLRKFPICTRATFYTWLKNEGKERARKGRSGVFPEAGRPTPERKLAIVERVTAGHEPVMDVAISTGYSRPTIYKWKRQYLAGGIMGLMGSKKPKTSKKVEPPSDDISKRLDEMQMQIDILTETIKVLKKRPAHQPKAVKSEGKGSDS